MAFEFVLDSSALLAYIYRERGMDKVESLLDRSAISVLNICETYAIMMRKGTPVAQAREICLGLSVPVVGFNDDLALETAALEGPTRLWGLSMGDRACLVTARHLNATAVTCDAAWSRIDVGVPIRAIR